MSLFSSSSTTRTNGGSSPTAPAEGQNGITDFLRWINARGQDNPQQYVPGASPLQRSAFSMGSRIANRYGANPGGGPEPSMGFGAPVHVGNGAFQMGGGDQPRATAGSGGNTLYGQSGVQPQGNIDWTSYVQNDPDLLNGYRNLSEQDRLNISRAMGDGSGYVDMEMFGRIHADSWGLRTENLPDYQPVSPDGGPATQGWAQPGYGYTMADDTAMNPVQGYLDAANMTRRVGSSGANLADVHTMNDRIDMGAAAQGRASRGIEFSKDYENRYTDNVVDTTLANFDEYAGRQRAAEAAQAAGNNAFGGSRFAVQRGITEENIARERASQEAGLRFGAQDRAFGFGAQDADRFTNTSIANAGMRNQRTEAQAGMDFNRLLTNVNAMNTNSMFNANQNDVADGRDLAAAGQLANISGQAADTERADLATLAQLGTDERNIEGDQRRAPLELAQLMSQLYGNVPWEVITGQRYNEQSSSSGTPALASILGSGLMAAGGLGWQPFGRRDSSAVET